jgi:hypothetical protein
MAARSLLHPHRIDMVRLDLHTPHSSLYLSLGLEALCRLAFELRPSSQDAITLQVIGRPCSTKGCNTLDLDFGVDKDLVGGRHVMGQKVRSKILAQF